MSQTLPLENTIYRGYFQFHSLPQQEHPYLFGSPTKLLTKGHYMSLVVCIVSAKTGQIGLEVKTWFSRFGDSERSLS